MEKSRNSATPLCERAAQARIDKNRAPPPAIQSSASSGGPSQRARGPPGSGLAPLATRSRGRSTPVSRCGASRRGGSRKALPDFGSVAICRGRRVALLVEVCLQLPERRDERSVVLASGHRPRQVGVFRFAVPKADGTLFRHAEFRLRSKIQAKTNCWLERERKKRCSANQCPENGLWCYSEAVHLGTASKRRVLMDSFTQVA